MKKFILWLCIVVLLFTFCGCGQENQKTNDSISPKPNIAAQVCLDYGTFERHLDEWSTHIVKAVCLGSTRGTGTTVYEFQVIDQYLGEEITDTFFLHFDDIYVDSPRFDFSYFYDWDFVPNETYFLLLTKWVDAISEHDFFTLPASQVYLPANNLSQSTIYGEPLHVHSNLDSYNTEEELVNYIVTYLETHPNPNLEKFIGYDYIRSDDLQVILDESQLIYKIKILKNHNYRVSDRDTFTCKVQSALKGDLPSTTSIDITFPKNAVSEGDECIVALFYYDNAHYLLSSKQSVFQPSAEEKILDYLD